MTKEQVAALTAHSDTLAALLEDVRDSIALLENGGTMDSLLAKETLTDLRKFLSKERADVEDYISCCEYALSKQD